MNFDFQFRFPNQVTALYHVLLYGNLSTVRVTYYSYSTSK